MIRLKKIRKKKGLLQKDIGKILGVTPYAASRYEREERMLNQEQIVKLCLALDVTPGELLGFQEEYEKYSKYLLELSNQESSDFDCLVCFTKKIIPKMGYKEGYKTMKNSYIEDISDFKVMMNYNYLKINNEVIDLDIIKLKKRVEVTINRQYYLEASFDIILDEYLINFRYFDNSKVSIRFTKGKKVLYYSGAVKEFQFLGTTYHYLMDEMFNTDIERKFSNGIEFFEKADYVLRTMVVNH